MLDDTSSGSSDLLLRPVSAQPASPPALLSPFRGHTQPTEHPELQQSCGQAESRLGSDSELGLQRDRSHKVSLLRTSSCPASPWCDQTCTGSDPAPGSSAVSLWPSCCPRTCHLEWLLGSGYGSCRHRAEGRHAREPQQRADNSVTVPVPRPCQFSWELSLQHVLELQLKHGLSFRAEPRDPSQN